MTAEEKEILEMIRETYIEKGKLEPNYLLDISRRYAIDMDELTDYVEKNRDEWDVKRGGIGSESRRHEREVSHRDENYGGHYEYRVIALMDKNGEASATKLAEELNYYAREGFRLVRTMTNEVGRESLSGTSNVNDFVLNDQMVLIMERFVKSKS
jgi:hypothetical protein